MIKDSLFYAFLIKTICCRYFLLYKPFNKSPLLFFVRGATIRTFVSSITDNGGAKEISGLDGPTDLKLFMRLYTGNRPGANEHRVFFCSYL